MNSTCEYDVFEYLLRIRDVNPLGLGLLAAAAWILLPRISPLFPAWVSMFLTTRTDSTNNVEEAHPLRAQVVDGVAMSNAEWGDVLDEE